jgi:hypothetical protein
MSPFTPPGEGAVRGGLRVPGTVWFDAPDRAGARVLRVDPPDGARGVFRDAPVVACLSRPADTRTVSPETFVVMDEAGAVPGGVWTSLDGRIVVWTPGRLLSAGKLHCVRLAGLRDVHGRDMRVHESAFVPGDLSLNDLSP